ncbi:MAG: glutathione S-transferase family protein [Myxococcales bacterium]|nr:glutathione S-transferase family protein [Myxococcales bacterium]
MTKPKLTYFDAPVSRGEECRLALHIAGVDFEDVRLKFDAWQAHKPKTPFGALPVWEEPGKPPIAHSNAILVLIGRRHGLHPKDDFEAAQHENFMCYVEDLRAKVSPTLRIKDADEKKRVREELATSFLPEWGGNVERLLGDGPFISGDKLHVADIKLHMAVRWFVGGAVDHIPATVFADFKKLTRLHDAVRDDARVKAWYAKG